MENNTLPKEVAMLTNALVHLEQISRLMQNSHLNDAGDVSDVIEQECVKYIDPLQVFLNQRIIEVITGHVAKNAEV